jgi:hypothetical protein
VLTRSVRVFVPQAMSLDELDEKSKKSGYHGRLPSYCPIGFELLIRKMTHDMHRRLRRMADFGQDSKLGATVNAQHESQLFDLFERMVLRNMVRYRERERGRVVNIRRIIIRSIVN